MDPASIAFLGSLGLKGLGALFGSRSKKKKAKEQKRATVAGLNIRQKQGEDARRSRVDAAQSILGRVPATTAGGGVNTNVGLDPELVKRLSAERTYDFGSAIPDEGAGGFEGFLSGLFGGGADLLPSLVRGGPADNAIVADPTVGRAQADGPLGGALSGGVAAPTIDWDELLRQAGGGGGQGNLP